MRTSSNSVMVTTPGTGSSITSMMVVSTVPAAGPRLCFGLRARDHVVTLPRRAFVARLLVATFFAFLDAARFGAFLRRLLLGALPPFDFIFRVRFVRLAITVTKDSKLI